MTNEKEKNLGVNNLDDLNAEVSIETVVPFCVKAKDIEEEHREISNCTEEGVLNFDCPALYFNRELSWLEFNTRVLEHACDECLPVLEQLKFLAIFHNNLDEFFMVRVANVFCQYNMGAPATGSDKISPAKQLTEIRKKVMKLLSNAHAQWNKNVYPRLAEKGISIKSYADLSEKQKKFLEGYYESEIYPILTPQAIDPSRPLPNISNVSLNFIVQLEGIENGDPRFARMRCPRNVGRFIFVPRTKISKDYLSLGLDTNIKDADIVLLEDVIAIHLDTLFPGYKVLSYGLFRITRNTDIEIEEDEADDLLDAIKDLLDQRRFGDVVRLETTHGMNTELTEFLVKKLHLKPIQIYRTKGPLAFADMIGLYGVEKPSLKETNFQAHSHPAFWEGDIFSYLQSQDILLNHPYDSYMSVVEFIRKASEDLNVVAIKQTLYRVGNDSPIVRALIEARRRGKQVTAVVELKARFDEERNITWAEELEKAGVNLVYGLVGMKIHAKLCLVVRKEQTGIERYVHIGTGNYNPSTAKMYTDMSLFTSHDDICSDVTKIFNAMTGYAAKNEYSKLIVSPSTMRPSLVKCIEEEIQLHKKNGKGHIILKCNQLVDKTLICKLYEASMSGVRVDLIVRGICTLVPGIPSVSENIFVRSIVGRFLEHTRIFYFRHNKNSKVYIGSADLMARNLDRRIEVCVPVLQENLRVTIKEMLDIQLSDNSQTWELTEVGAYKRKHRSSKEKVINCQERMMARVKKRKD